MRRIEIDIDIFERDDLVSTPEGEGVVLTDEPVMGFNPYLRRVVIRLKEGTSDFPNGLLEVDGNSLVFMDEEDTTP